MSVKGYPGLYQRKCGTWNVKKSINGKLICGSCKTKNIGAAKQMYHIIVSGDGIHPHQRKLNSVRCAFNLSSGESTWGMYLDSPEGKKWLRQRLAMSRSSAKKRGIENLLTLDDVRDIAYRSGGNCELSGIPFSYDISTNSALDDLYSQKPSKAPYSPSMDRIDSNMGYRIENCRLVCTCVNIALNEWGDDVYLKMCNSTVERQNISLGSAPMERNQPLNPTITNK